METKFLVLQSLHHISLVEWTLKYSKNWKTDLFALFKPYNAQNKEQLNSKPFSFLMKPYDLIRKPCHTFEGVKVGNLFGICPSIKHSLYPVQTLTYQNLIMSLMQEKQPAEEVKKNHFFSMTLLMNFLSRVWYSEGKRFGDKTGSANDSNAKKDVEIKKEKIEKLKDKLSKDSKGDDDFPKFK